MASPIPRESLTRLVHAYNRGLLVPFLGSGMSRESAEQAASGQTCCPDWETFVRGLESIAGLSGNVGLDNVPMPERADRAMRKLRMRGERYVRDAIRHALNIPLDQSRTLSALLGHRPSQVQTLPMPPQTDALARLLFPLAVTTNYDYFYATAVLDHWKAYCGTVDVKGRSQSDCQDVLRTLRTPSSPIVWAIQGYLPPPKWVEGLRGEPADTLVVGHHDYRRVTHGEPHFRKAFSEVFRSRSFLFVGSGLKEAYVQDLFSEVLEFHGTNPQYHFAFVRKGECNADFLRTRFNIDVLEYDDYGDLVGWLEQLHDGVRFNQARCVNRQYCLSHSGLETYRAANRDQVRLTTPPPASDLEIICGTLTLPQSPGECVAVSGGGGHGASRYLSEQIRDLVRSARDIEGFSAKLPHPSAPPRVDRYGLAPLYCVLTRNEDGARDLRANAKAIRLLCDAAVRDGYDTIRTQLFAVGRGKAFPGYYSLITMVRAFAAWRRDNPDHAICLKLHVIDPDVILELTSSRIDILELISQSDIRFWVELQLEGASVERHIEYCDGTTTISAIAEKYHASAPDWVADVIPSPTRDRLTIALKGAEFQQSIAEHGIVPGSTLRLRRK